MHDPPPEKPQAAVFFYGWVILLVAILAQILTAPGQTVGVSEFKDIYGERLQLTSRTVALYYCYGTALGSFALPLFGFLIDRMGCRFSLILVSFLLGITCLFCGVVSSPLQMLLAFTFLRMLGQGALSLVASTLVSLWFKRKLALAYSVMSVGSGTGMMFIPYIFKPLFSSFELAFSFQVIALGIFLLIPLGWWLVIDRPGRIGLSQDGDPREDNDEPVHDPSSEMGQAGELPGGESGAECSTDPARSQFHPDDFTFAEAISTRAFWIVTLAQSAWALIGTGLVFNRKSIFGALNAADFLVDLAVPGLFGAVIIGQILTGAAAKHFRHATLFASGSLGMAVACGLILLKTPVAAFAGFMTFGFAQGIFVIMGQSLWADFYGRSHIGKIRGLVWMIVILASSLGGFALTLGETATSRFAPIEYSMAVMGLLSCGCLFIRKPTKGSPKPLAMDPAHKG